MKIIDPATEKIIAEIQEDDFASIQDKYQQAKDAQPLWRNVSLEERISVLAKFSQLLDQNIKALSLVLTNEVGKPLQQSVNEIRGAINRIEWFNGNANKYLSDEVMHAGTGLEERITYEPLGVVCNISAWNYPYLVGVNVFAPALIAGNAVVYKPSEFAIMTGFEIEKTLMASGLPEHVFQVAIGGKEAGEALLELSFDGFFFTGSYKTGKYIYEKVASKMVPCQCELGGKDPLYVADDIADIKAAAASTADGAFYNNGQSCCSVERIYVHEKIYNEFVDAFVSEVKTWKMGLPTEPGVYFGPLTRKDQVGFLEKQISDAVNKGAKILIGGKKAGGRGYYFEPTILINVNHEMQVMKEESFGPVIGIMKVKSDEEVIELMEDTEYGLTASVYSGDESRALKILQQINSGSGYWNCCDRVSACLPWSGRKHSGFGVTLSHAGLRAFVRPKALHLRGK
jgi:acyl-CoA reductase-like NAD-dependent aldehyde dehydrogenase